MRTMSETAKMLHVNLAPGEAGRYAIVPGDPDPVRADRPPTWTTPAW